MIVQALTNRIHNYHNFQLQQLADYPEYGLNGDIRISTLTKTLSGMTGYQLSLIFGESILSNQNWWTSNFPNSGITQHDIEIRTSAYNNLSLIGFYTGFFMSIESSFRAISVAIDSNANNAGKAEFYNIYNFVFNSLSLQKYNPLFDILRLIRNTIHNNGMYIPKNSGNITINYNGIDYDFIENKIAAHINQIDNKNLYYFLDEVLICLKEVFSHTQILAIQKIEEKFKL